MRESNLPPPPAGIEKDIPSNQMNSELGEYFPIKKTNCPEDDKYLDSKYRQYSYKDLYNLNPF